MNSPARPNRSINRRTFLRGLGVGLALPALESVDRAHAKPKSAPRRMLIISNNLGVLPQPFFPTRTGPDYEATPYLEELKAFRKDLTVFSGLSHPACVGGHSTENCFLTGAKDPTGSGFRNTISLDQFAVNALGQQTRFPTLNLGVNIDRANRSLSWTRDGALLPAEDSPARLFKKMFVQGNQKEVAERLHKLRERGSILDAVAEDMNRFRGRLGANDKDRVDQYFTSIRELESRLHTAGEWEQQPKPKTDREPPKDILDKAKFFEKFQLMLSMGRLAIESDSTRIVTLMVDAFATPVFEIAEDLRSLNGYHNLSHHGQVKAKLDQLEKVDRRQMRLLLETLTGLAETREDEARLLDRTMVLYGSNMGDANTHDNTNLPVLLAGGGFKHGCHLAFNRENNTPLCNLFVSMLQRLGVEAETFSSGESALADLEIK